MTFLEMDDGVKIYYEDSGKGEALIFAHGLNSSHRANMDFYDYFKDDYRVILYDQRGHGDSERPQFHMNVKRLGKDLNEIIKSLKLSDVTVIGHSMGAATIYSYISQYGCDKLKRIVASDMSPYMRNDGWRGGIGQGMWSDEDFMCDFDRIFDNVGNAAFHISKHLMDTSLSDISGEKENELVRQYQKSTDTLTMASLWFSLFRSDQRPAIDKITVPFLYIMPENPLYSMEAVSYIKKHVKGTFVLENNFKNTTHAIWRQKPKEVSDAIKRFIQSY